MTWRVDRVEQVCFKSSFESVQAGESRIAADILSQVAGAKNAKECNRGRGDEI